MSNIFRIFAYNKFHFPMIDFSQFDNLISLTTYFNSNDICKKAIVESRWGDGDVFVLIAVVVIVWKEPMADSDARNAEETFLAL